MDLSALAGAGAGMGGPGAAGSEAPTPDTAETIHVSSLALLKMLKHCRAGVPFEVMGLMLGDFVDDYTVRVVDVFAMPQLASNASVEAVDPVYQQQFMDLLKQTGRPETVVGWYHSHPGWGCWLSGVDMNTQQSFEQLHPRCVAVVVDPVQSVRGKVIMDAFRLISPQRLMMRLEPRQTTSVVGHLKKPSIQALVHGLNRHYYSMVVSTHKNDLDDKMLLNLHRPNWAKGLHPTDFARHTDQNREELEKMATLVTQYNKRVQEEEGKDLKEVAVANVGKLDAKKRLEASVETIMTANISQALASMLDTVCF